MILSPRRPAIPVATYRVQLTADFGFDAASAIVPYLKSLGITHLYASPFMKARQGSTHGYDIVDHTKINPELGGDAGFERLSRALKQHDLGLILDFVPNHVGVHFADNPWWLDVLEWGPASPHAVSFDIDWDILPFRARGGVLLPIIGNPVARAGRADRTSHEPTGRRFSAWYFEHQLPIAPERFHPAGNFCATSTRSWPVPHPATIRACLTLQGIAPIARRARLQMN
jgi:(1->4)-alpha-D-glucan 1-alpha-D-glucosylmutase